MDPEQFPPCSLRREILGALKMLHEDTDATVVPPQGIVAVLNQTGPSLKPEHVLMVEVLLDRMWEDGLVGRVPAVTDLHAKGYCIRAAVDEMIAAGIPIFLQPLAPQFQPKHRLRRLM